MKAIRLEEAENWAAARDAWHLALAALSSMSGPIVEATRHEFAARAKVAHDRADEPFDRPAFKEQSAAEIDPAEDPDPGAAKSLDPGETQGSSGAR